MSKSKKKRRKRKSIFKRILALFILGLIVYGCFFFRIETIEIFKPNNDSDIVDTDVLPKETSLSLVMVGDALIHSAVYYDAQVDNTYNFKPMLDIMKPIISSYDLAYYNQETILGGSELGLSTYPRFNSPYELGNDFLDTGFNIVSMANNHTLDRGEQAIINSCNYWKTKDVYTAGSYCSEEDREEIKIFEKNGIKYAMLSYTTTTNGLKAPSGKEYFLNV